MVKKRDSKEDIELAKQHIELAENIILDKAKNCQGNSQKLLGKATFELEKAEADIEDAEEE